MIIGEISYSTNKFVKKEINKQLNLQLKLMKETKEKEEKTQS